MKVDKIKKAISELTPSEELSERIMDMAASYEKSAVITEQPIRTVRPGRMLKLAAIAAALVILMAVSVYGIVNRLFYLPGAGLVDEDGMLVIREDDIGDLDITAYKTPEEYELGGFVIESVTYTEYNGLASFTIWSHMGDELMASYQKDSYGNPKVTVADHVIEDLKIILPDGSSLAPESVRSSSSGSIVYNFAAEKLNTKLTLVSEGLGAELKVELGLVEDVGYSYMEYPTDKGITLIMSPANEEFSEFSVDFIDNTISDGFAEYISESALSFNTAGVLLYDSNNKRIPWSSFHGGTKDRGVNISIAQTPSDNGYDIKKASANRLIINYFLQNTNHGDPDVLLDIPADGEYICKEIEIFTGAGFDAKITGYSREGNQLKIYANGFQPDKNDFSIRFNYIGIPYNGSNGCTSAYVFYTLSLKDADYFSIGNEWVQAQDGSLCRTFDFSKMPEGGLDSVEQFYLSASAIACIFEGNWTVNY
ncbi:MAG: hypothetical protein IJA85_12210 [Clostridia bacterium]|nr:hypothetical protein [Clostridia bacterium]